MSETLHHLSSINTSVGWLYGTERTGLPLEMPCQQVSFLTDPRQSAGSTPKSA